MAGDYGILISGKDNNVQTLDDIIYSTKYSTAKIDTSNPAGFQTVTLTFLNDPPNPNNTINETLVGSIPHNYTYIPSYWVVVTIASSTPGSIFQQQYFQDSGIIRFAGDAITGSVAVLTTRLDNKNINFYIEKDDFSGGTIPSVLTGYVLKIGLYVFAEDVGV